MDTKAKADGTAPAEPQKKKSLFEAILTATPVLLTVVATFMVGQSTGEMTRAQYHRSVAGQTQSKVGDEWAYFQAKRIRGTIYEMNADRLVASEEPVPVTLKYVQDSVKELGDLGDKIGKGKEQENAAKAIAQVASGLEKGFTVDGKFRHAPDKVKKAFETMSKMTVFKVPGPLVDAAEQKKDESEDLSVLTGTDPDTQKKLLKLAMKMIENRKPEKEIAAVVIKVTDETLRDEMDATHKKGKEEAAALKDPEYTLEAVDQLMFSMASALNSFLQYLDTQQDKKETTAEIRRRLHGLMTSYTMARHTYSHRRYEKDARNNQQSANLFEVSVALSSARSDRHLERSKNFMYAMLVAQVGVIVASAAVAVKKKSLVWTLAVLAGLVAIGFGGYVYVGMN
jgi:Domain of unknown function (DUF4337)